VNLRQRARSNGRWAAIVEFNAAIDKLLELKPCFKQGDLDMRDVLQNDDPMKNIMSNLKIAAIISFITLLPFALLQFTFNTVTRQNASDLTVLFGLLWILSMAFIVILMPVAQNIGAGNSVVARPVNLLLRVIFSALILIMWVGIIIDQLPCFLGLPNCD
jgi:hypothetical protein